MKCNHDRTIQINAHSSDLNFVTVPHLGIEKEGYLPDIEGLCSGDDVNIEVCLDCGHVVGFEKMTDKEIKAALKGEDEDEDEDDGGSWDDENLSIRPTW